MSLGYTKERRKAQQTRRELFLERILSIMLLLTPRPTQGAFFAAATVAAIVFSALPANAAPPKARVSAQQAEAAAVRRIPGHALSAKYEFEDGHWQYAVLVKDSKGQLYEAEVSAATGKVTATEKTSAAEEASEAAADKKAAMKSGKK